MPKLLTASFVLSLVFFVTTAMSQVDERSRGIDLYRAGNFTGAIDALQKAVEANSKDKISLIYLGGALINTGKTKEARKVFPKLDVGDKIRSNVDEDVSVVKRPRPRYTDEARDNNVSGTVLMLVEFRADGTIGFIYPLRSLMFGLTESSIDSIKGSTFKPAVKDGKPVTVIQTMTNTYSVR